MIPHDPDLAAKAQLVNEHLVDSALELIGAVRDGGPDAVRDVLARVPFGCHDNLAVVLAAMVDPDRSVFQLLAWSEMPLGVKSTAIELRPQDRVHGSTAGFLQHLAAGERPCGQCLAGSAAAAV